MALLPDGEELLESPELTVVSGRMHHDRRLPVVVLLVAVGAPSARAGMWMPSGGDAMAAEAEDDVEVAITRAR